jgi:hypothetical protein
MITSRVIDARSIQRYLRAMVIQRNGELAANEILPTPTDLDPEGLRILREAGFVWDSETVAFQRRQPGHPERARSAAIEYRFLREQKLVVNSSLSMAERIGQLQRLRILIQSMD